MPKRASGSGFFARLRPPHSGGDFHKTVSRTKYAFRTAASCWMKASTLILQIDSFRCSAGVPVRSSYQKSTVSQPISPANGLKVLLLDEFVLRAASVV